MDENQQKEAVFERIAQKHLHIETLKTRNRDALDFHDVSVWGVHTPWRKPTKQGKPPLPRNRALV